MKIKKNKGFSLVELVVVVLIMAIIAVALAPQVMKWVDEARVSTDEQNFDSLMSQVQLALADPAVYAEITAMGDAEALTLSFVENPANDAQKKVQLNDKVSACPLFLAKMDELDPNWRDLVKKSASFKGTITVFNNGTIQKTDNGTLGDAVPSSTPAPTTDPSITPEITPEASGDTNNDIEEAKTRAEAKLAEIIGKKNDAQDAYDGRCKYTVETYKKNCNNNGFFHSHRWVTCTWPTGEGTLSGTSAEETVKGSKPNETTTAESGVQTTKVVKVSGSATWDDAIRVNQGIKTNISGYLGDVNSLINDYKKDAEIAGLNLNAADSYKNTIQGFINDLP